VAIPGASAVTTALSISGLTTAEFTFMGFPPASGAARTRWLKSVAQEERPIVFFEAPHRIKRTLGELASLSVTRPIIVYRELTKQHEESVTMDGEWQLESLKQLGEFTVILGAGSAEAVREPEPGETLQIFGRLTELAGFSETEAYAFIAGTTNLPPKSIAKIIKKAKISVNQQRQSSP
jgi:16S rRNA (cytidine1402-2'-O)-methyltransferase